MKPHSPPSPQAAPASTEVQLAAQAAAAGTKDSRRFQQLLARIEQARERLAAWQGQLPLFAQAHEARVRPLIQRMTELNRAWALELEQLMLGRKWSKSETQTLERLLGQLLEDALASAEGTDEELHALYQRLHGQSVEEAQRAQLAEIKARLEASTGLDLGEAPPETLEELVKRARTGLKDREAQTAAGEDDGMQRDDADAKASRDPMADQPGARPRKPRKPSAAQQRAQAEAARVTQSVKEVFRKLAAALHPDRAPAEATDAERSLRGERMARANAAYAAGDLLTLLTLQLQIEQLDLAQAAQLPEEQIRHFNRVLAEQLKELEADIGERERAFCEAYGYTPRRRPDPHKLKEWLTEEVRQLEVAEARMRHDQRIMRSDPSGAKRLLKQLGAEMRMEDQMEQWRADTLGW
jgi:hypothetical protein